eukprot:1255515-Karenia_brevis.AAC.1
MKRCTSLVESCLSELKLDDWVVEQRRRKWRLAGHTVRRTDGRWSTAMCEWTPTDGYRRRGHPVKRWDTDLDAFFASTQGLTKRAWIVVAQNRKLWQNLENDFVKQAWYC